ncbi:MAG: carbamoyltransferase [Kiritimatiellae bacterium]|nr:carbamoyltransferase [Kiritimatiellia bacterium]
MNILGISAFYHDSAAALVRDGKIIAAAQEERFSRKKHDERFPFHAVRYCLHEAGVGPEDLDGVAFYDKPIQKFERILQTYFAVAPSGLKSFMMAMPLWIREKLWIPLEIEKSLEECGIKPPKEMFFPEHHESHAASAFYPSPYQSAAILTVDGVGEWATTTLGHGRDHELKIISDLHFPHSLGLLYSAFTYFTGFRVNSGEYKLMGLAPYGEPKYVQKIYDNLLSLREDGSFKLNQEYFNYMAGLTMTNDKFADLFGGPARTAESDISQREMDLASSIQVVTEEIVLKMANHLHKITGEKNLCLAGGVALNCVANGRLLREGPFENVWIQPAAGDAGGALGAALTIWHHVKGNPRKADGVKDSMRGSYLGPNFDDEVEEFLKAKGYPAQKLTGEAWAKTLAKVMAEENVVGLLQGRMEFGPRALGGRSIVGDPRSEKMQSVMNLKIKYRESFRPFAPSCCREHVSDYFDHDRESPYMLLVAPVKKELWTDLSDEQKRLMKDPDLRKRVNVARSTLPAITHVDYSARIQTVERDVNQRYYDLIKAFGDLTGVYCIINTSFNVRGEPIVCTPEDAYRCFMRTEMDYLVLGDFVLSKAEQPEWEDKANWREDYVLD